MELTKILHSQDFNKSAKQIALDLIELFNGVRYRPEKIVLGEPSSLDIRPDIDWDENSFITVDIDRSEELRFSDELNGFIYRRVPLKEILNACCLEIHAPKYPFKTSDVLDQINNQLNVQFTLRDLLEEEFSEAGKITFHANPRSWAWLGELEANVVEDGSELLLSKTNLSGFKAHVKDPSDQTHSYTGSSLDRLTALMNQDNLTSLVHGTDFVFENLRVVENNPDFNTEVTFRPLNPAYKSQVLRYRRLSINVLTLLEDSDIYLKPVKLTAIPFTTQSLLGEINTSLGLALTASEVLDVNDDGLWSAYELTIPSPTASFAWTESTYFYSADLSTVLRDARVTDDGSLRIVDDGSVRMTEETA